jgi:hypothetical protein
MKNKKDKLERSENKQRSRILMEILRVIDQLKQDFPHVYKNLDEIPLQQTSSQDDPSNEDLKHHLNSLKHLITSN